MIGARLIVNADDFGWSRGINEAIADAHESGILTSASLMANQPASEQAIALARNMPGLGVGMHLNLCAGRPVLPAKEVPSLVGANGEFHRPADMFRKLWRFQVASEEVEAEFRAQIRWVRERGVVLTHADSHLHVHLYPAALGAFVRTLKHERIECMRAPRCSVWPPRGLGGAHEGGVARRLLVQSYRGALQAGPFREFSMPDSRISFRAADRRDHDAIGRCWISALNYLPAGIFELACHPGFMEPGFSESDRIAAQRVEEFRWLTSAAFRAAVLRNKIQLISYSGLCEPSLKRTQAIASAA
ncbi:MAG TPA: ChbG/HpnK family deacetylase [Candidatus Aquilonibacter sp.]|nr:ChbG/HpnK family deacetylase [Candidatus Aquilonibacter sp.]